MKRRSCSSTLALSLALIAHWGCSDAGTDGPDAPPFTGTGAAGAPGTTAPVGNMPGASSPNDNGATPTNPIPAGSEQPQPVAGGIDNSGTAGPGGAASGAGGTSPSGPSTPPGEQPGTEGAVAASPGCGLSQGIPQNPSIDSTIITFPQIYDGSTPVPLVFGFHGANRTNLEQQTVDSRTVGSDLEKNYVMAYVKSAGTAWDLGTDYRRFQAIRTQILSQFCIDTAHVFAFGHSSGAQFIAQMLGDNSTRETGFAAIAPVSSSRYGNPPWSPVPTLLIHGLNDTARPGDSNGAQDISQYTESNQCTDQFTMLGVPTCTSFTGDATVNPGCKEYVGCAAPTLFCNHDDPNYRENGRDTNHGWPCFANSQIFQFFESQR